MSMKTRLDRHLVACSAVAAAGASVGVVQNTEAAIVYSGVVNLAGARNVNGIYLNVINGARNDLAGATGGSSVPGYDINVYGSTNTMSFFTDGGAGATTQRGYLGNATTAFNLALNAPIDGTGVYSTGVTTAGNTNFAPGSTGLAGFRFLRESDSTVHFGWFHISYPASGTAPYVIVDYAYDDVAGAAIPAGAIPAPGSVALLALGAMGLTGRRRK